MFLVNVRTTTKRMNLQTNTGAAIINENGELPGFGTVWVHRKGIANILSLDVVADTPGFHIDYSTRIGTRDFVVETAKGETKRFVGNGRGLHYLDCSHHFGPDRNGCVFGKEIYNTEKRMTWRQDESSFLVETVDGNKLQFSTRDVHRADELRRFKEIAAFPNQDTLRRSINKNVIKDSPHTLRDLNITHRIHGRSRYTIQGKRTRQRNKAVEVDQATILVSRSLNKYYQAITLCADIMFINTNPVLITILCHLHYSTGQVLRSTKLNDLEGNLINVMKEYQYRGFAIRLLLVDKQFEGLEHRFVGVTVNTVSRDEHVPEVERLTRTIKERCRCYFALIPFKKIPHRMAIELVNTCIFYINAFPWISGPKKTLSPFTIVQGRHLNYHKHFRVIFGEYAQTYEGTDNTMKKRAVGAIALGPTGNAQGGVNFFSLYSGRVLNRRMVDYDFLPMPADAIVRVEKMARRSPSGLIFGNRNNILDPDDDDDSPNDPTYTPSDLSVSSSSSESNDTKITGVNDEDSNSNNNNNNEDDPRNKDNDNNNHEDNDNNNDTEDNANNNTKNNPNNNNPSEHNDTNTVEDNDNNNNATRTRSGRQVRRNKRDANIYEYNHFHVDADCDIVLLPIEN